MYCLSGYSQRQYIHFSSVYNKYLLLKQDSNSQIFQSDFVFNDTLYKDAISNSITNSKGELAIVYSSGLYYNKNGDLIYRTNDFNSYGFFADNPYAAPVFIRKPDNEFIYYCFIGNLSPNASPYNPNHYFVDFIEFDLRLNNGKGGIVRRVKNFIPNNKFHIQAGIIGRDSIKINFISSNFISTIDNKKFEKQGKSYSLLISKSGLGNLETLNLPELHTDLSIFSNIEYFHSFNMKYCYIKKTKFDNINKIYLYDSLFIYEYNSELNSYFLVTKTKLLDNTRFSFTFNYSTSENGLNLILNNRNDTSTYLLALNLNLKTINLKKLSSNKLEYLFHDKNNEMYFYNDLEDNNHLYKITYIYKLQYSNDFKNNKLVKIDSTIFQYYHNKNLASLTNYDIKNSIRIDFDCDSKYHIFNVNNGHKGPFLWDFGDGNNLITDSNFATHKYLKEGSYNLKTIVIGQKDTLYNIVKVNKPFNTQIVPIDTVVFNTFKFNLPSDASYSYHWENNDTLKDRAIKETTNYSLKVNIGDCENIFKGIINVINFDVLKNINCNDEYIDLHILSDADSIKFFNKGNWYLLNKVGNEYLLKTNKFNLPSLYLKCYSYGKNIDTNLILNHIVIEKLNLGNDTLLCFSEKLKIVLDSSYNQIVWNDQTKNFIKDIKEKGTYFVKVTKNNCVFEDTINVDFIQCQTPNKTICLNQTILFNFDKNIDSIIVNLENEEYKSNSSSIELLFKTSGSKTIKFNIHKNGLYKIIYSNIFVNEMPNNILPTDTILCKSINSVKNYFNFYNVEPIIPTGIFNHSQEFIKFKLTDNNCTTKDSILIKYEICNCELFIPNAFSPNHNFINDNFKIISDCQLKIHEFKIFNLWGEEIYNIVNTNEINWDATFNSVPCPQGNYFYTIVYTDELSDVAKFKKGTFVLLK